MVKIFLHAWLTDEYRHIGAASEIPHFRGMTVGDVIKHADILYDHLSLIVLDGLSVTSETTVNDGSRVDFYPHITAG